MPFQNQPVLAAKAVLSDTTEKLSEMHDEWIDTWRSCVQEQPITAIALALAAGALIAALAAR